ncbi:methylated-DNA-[protein]-cysteine S-methyltransferase [Natronincola peptidivorans]|uniref:Methylated-DNA--protein-cysteine methyltransferase n=1 Tax=Natronincola peptidivorans TaxID=426128 RepID=A0A1I0DKP9_9FIRM|nr:methylated-DNA--[protein]-cysteine S-methyltransferase [Natronincola peptidivorans]SET32733.1 methylated-DNA-[protein]-cysteine S-methyltransferase [Natronincola peptidivorans]
MIKIFFSCLHMLDLQLYIASNEKGLVAIGINQSEESFIKDIKKFSPLENITYNKSKNHQFLQQITEYFQGARKQFTIPLDLKGTPFQKKVWNTLLEIPFGEVVSYQTIANKIGNPKAVRAVGLANKRNPIPIIVPCHRVIGMNMKLVGYNGGIDIKEKLLAFEGIKIEKEKVVNR